MNKSSGSIVPTLVHPYSRYLQSQCKRKQGLRNNINTSVEKPYQFGQALWWEVRTPCYTIDMDNSVFFSQIHAGA